MKTLPLICFWDIDGTLIRNNGRKNLFLRAVNNVGNTSYSLDLSPHGKTDKYIVEKYVEEAKTLWQSENPDAPPKEFTVEDVTEELERLSADYYNTHKGTVLPGVVDALTWVAWSGGTNALLTGNSMTRSRLKLDSAGIDCSMFDWNCSVFGNETPHREELAKKAKKHVQEKQCAGVIVGDTISDAQAAKTANMPFVGVATGVYSVSKLETYPNVGVFQNIYQTSGAFKESLHTVSSNYKES